MRRSAPLSGRFVASSRPPAQTGLPTPSAPLKSTHLPRKAKGRNIVRWQNGCANWPSASVHPQGGHRAPLGPCHARSSSCPTLANIVVFGSSEPETTMFGGARFVPGTRFVARDRVGRAVPAILKGRVSYNPNTHGFQALGQINRKRPPQTRLFSAYTAKYSCIWCLLAGSSAARTSPQSV